MTDQLLSELRYNGRTLEVRVYVNTDEDALEVAKRVQAVVAGARDDTAVASAVVLPEETAEKLWGMVFEQARVQALAQSGGEPKTKVSDEDHEQGT